MRNIILLGLILAIFSCDTQKNNISKPNIVLILADDLGYETIGAYGGQSYQTPNIDKITRQGVLFTKAYANPLCTPSRVKIMTGKYNFRNYERFGFLNPEEKTFANHLQEAGYKTAITGKWQLGGDLDAPHGFGFDSYCLWQLEEGDFWYRYKNPRIIKDGERISVDSMVYGPDVFVEFALNFIDQNDNEPFLLYYPMVLVHDPFQPPPVHPDYKGYPIEGLNDTAYFHDMVFYMDLVIGKMYDHLQSKGLLENTIFIFTGDNGTDRKVKSRFNNQWINGNKGYTTDAGIHVPLVVAGTNAVKGLVSDALVDFSDFLPTLLEIASVRLPENEKIDGVSFLPAIKGGSEAQRRWIYTSYDPKGRDFPGRNYAFDHTHKLYDNGWFFNYAIDPAETEPLDTLILTQDQQVKYEGLKKVLNTYNSEM